MLTRPDATARDTLGTGMYFITYESSKQLLTTFGGDGTHNNPLAVLVAGGMCGIVSWALICKLWSRIIIVSSKTNRPFSRPH